MAKKDDKLVKLGESVEVQANSLDPAQRDFVMAQFAHYQWNEERIEALEEQLEAGVVDEYGCRDYDADAKLFRQRHQLVAEQGTLFSHIMRWLKGTSTGKSDFEKFLEGE